MSRATINDGGRYSGKATPRQMSASRGTRTRRRKHPEFANIPKEWPKRNIGKALLIWTGIAAILSGVVIGFVFLIKSVF